MLHGNLGSELIVTGQPASGGGVFFDRDSGADFVSLCFSFWGLCSWFDLRIISFLLRPGALVIFWFEQRMGSALFLLLVIICYSSFVVSFDRV